MNCSYSGKETIKLQPPLFKGPKVEREGCKWQTIWELLFKATLCQAFNYYGVLREAPSLIIIVHRTEVMK